MSASLVQNQIKITRHVTLDFLLVETANIVSLGGDPYLRDVVVIMNQKGIWEVVYYDSTFQVNYLRSSVATGPRVVADVVVDGASSAFSLKRRQGWTSAPAMRVYVRGVEV